MKPIPRGTLCWVTRSSNPDFPSGTVVMVLRYIGPGRFPFRGQVVEDAYHVRDSRFNQAAINRRFLVPFSIPTAVDAAGNSDRFEVRSEPGSSYFRSNDPGETFTDYPPMPQPGERRRRWSWGWWPES